jgi:hypothetical protein
MMISTVTGSNNDSYRFAWRNPKWKLPQGRYRVEIIVRSAGQKISKTFLLYNDPARDDFRLCSDPYPAEMQVSEYPPNISDRRNP